MANFKKYISSIFENWLPEHSEKFGDNWFHVYLSNVASKLFYHNETAKFSNGNAYFLSKHVAEIFYPIDSIADRVSALRFDVVDKDGNIVEPPENIKRLLLKPNPFSSFSSLVYNSVFNELSDGNNYLYTKIPRSFKSANPDLISSVWCLEPDKVDIKLKIKRPSIFDIKNSSELIDSFIYSKYDIESIDPNYVLHERNIDSGDYRNGLKSSSPLNAVEQNINNILVVYQARFNVYDKNGMAGILTKKPSTQTLEQVYSDPSENRDAILNDILNRNGLTGDKRFWTVSSIPVEFIKTLATIQELQPFEETREDALQIAGIYGVDKDLIPMKQGTTFNNKKEAEKKLYQNVIKGIAHDKASTLTEAFYLDKIGLKFKPNYEDVEALQEDIEVSHRGDGLLLENIKKMEELNSIDEKDKADIINKLISKYKDGRE